MADDFDKMLGAVKSGCVSPQHLAGQDKERLEKLVAKLKSREVNWQARGVQAQLYRVMRACTAMTCGRDCFRLYIQQRLADE